MSTNQQSAAALVIILVIASVAIVIVIVPSVRLDFAPKSLVSVIVSAPAEALYGDDVPIQVYINNEGASPVLSATAALDVSLNGQTVYHDSSDISLQNPANLMYNVKLAYPNSVLETFADKASIVASVSSPNAQPIQNSTTIEVLKPSATISADIPNQAPWFSTPSLQLAAGTYVFNKLTATYGGSDSATYPVAVGIVFDSQESQYFAMNNRLAQQYNDTGKTIWIIASGTIDYAYPVWNVPIESTQFTLSTGGATQATINFEIDLFLVVGNNQFLPIATQQETLGINAS